MNLRRLSQRIYSPPPLTTGHPSKHYLSQTLFAGLTHDSSHECAADDYQTTGADEGTRTLNLLITNQPLCQLSYAGLRSRQVVLYNGSIGRSSLLEPRLDTLFSALFFPDSAPASASPAAGRCRSTSRGASARRPSPGRICLRGTTSTPSTPEN